MIRLLPATACLALLAAWSVRAAEPPAPHKIGPLDTSCAVCHGELDGAQREPVTLAAEDVHFARGLSCHDCHGGNPAAGADGDPDAAHDRAHGFTGRPQRLEIPRFCARCHSDAGFMKRFDPQARVDQLSEYVTSRHGQVIASGDARAAVCVDCHGSHGMREVSSPSSPVHPLRLADTCARCHDDTSLMAAFRLPATQHMQYRGSVHAKALYDKGDLSAPTCNDCHGSHGAMPPGVRAVDFVCGTCHTREATLFREIEARRRIDLAACIQCVVCHQNHDIQPPTLEMGGVGPESTCIGCHVAGQPAWEAAAEMASLRERLSARRHQADELLRRAERAGVEVSEDRFALQKAADSEVELRVLVHTFDLARFSTVAAEGLGAAEAGVAAGDRAFRELDYRRAGLALSLFVIVAVIIGLVLTIRRLERPSGGADPQAGA
jgi:hypothetical protein